MNGRFVFHPTPLSGLILMERLPIGDSRGFLERMFCEEELAPLTGGKRIHQINRTLTAAAGTVRGMHYQRPPHAEVKLVTCLRGRVFDVAVDLRRDSPTFLQWHGEILDGATQKTLAIPEGFAHGFQTLTENCEMLYFHTAAYHPDAEAGLNPVDPTLGIAWPLPPSGLSPRDTSHPLLDHHFSGIEP